MFRRSQSKLLLDKFSTNRMADYVRFAKDINGGRTFKTISKDKERGLQVRQANVAEASSQLMMAAGSKSAVDDLSKIQGLEKLARVQRDKGDEKASKSTLTTR
jgi:hypothetical protein